MRALPAAPLAGMPEFLLGLAIVRGGAVPVVDAGALLAGSSPPGGSSRFVVLRAGPRRIALAVDEVLGVRELSAESVANLPPLLGSASAEIVEAVGTLDRELLLVLRAAHIVPASVWSAVDARGDVP